jgi:hypothetical protein
MLILQAASCSTDPVGCLVSFWARRSTRHSRADRIGEWYPEANLGAGIFTYITW